MFPLTVFEIVLFKGRSVLSPAQRGTESERVNGIAISAFIAPALLILFKNFDMNLNDSYSVTGSFRSSQQNWYKFPDVFE